MRSAQEGLQHVRGDEDLLAAFRQGAMNGKHHRTIRGIRTQLPAHSFLGIVSTPNLAEAPGTCRVLTSGSVVIQQGSSCLVVSIAVGSAQLRLVGNRSTQWISNLLLHRRPHYTSLLQSVVFVVFVV